MRVLTDVTNRDLLMSSTSQLLRHQQFTSHSKALVFKCDCSGLDPSSNSEQFALCYSEVNIDKAGKSVVRYQYDGSVFEKFYHRQLKNTVEYYLDLPEWQSACQDKWGLGYWLLVPIESITPEHSIECWSNVAKEEFAKKLQNKYGLKEDSPLIKSLMTSSIKMLDVEAWNELRKSIHPEWYRKQLITK